MTISAEKQMEHIGETRGVADCTHDLIRVLEDRIECLWRYDQYIANADGKRELQDCWREMKRQDQQTCDRLKRLLASELQQETSGNV
jgi:lysyl-tRNA synthetase class I